MASPAMILTCPRCMNGGLDGDTCESCEACTRHCTCRLEADDVYCQFCEFTPCQCDSKYEEYIEDQL